MCDWFYEFPDLASYGGVSGRLRVVQELCPCLESFEHRGPARTAPMLKSFLIMGRDDASRSWRARGLAATA